MGEQKQNIRPTKKQQELLEFITAFIDEHGYSPSYREIMAGCNYTSVATVSLHVNNLIQRGHILKREHSARSLEVVNPHVQVAHAVEPSSDSVHHQWLRQEITNRIALAEANGDEDALAEVAVLLAALRVFEAPQESEVLEQKLRELTEGNDAAVDPSLA